MGSAAVQGRLWSSAAHAWATLQEPPAQPLWEALLDAAAVGRRTRLLDAGCGAGGASVRAARRGAAVNGLDAAEALLAIARERVPDGDFRAGDLEALPYADASFDAIIASDVLPYVADPLAALRELRRVCTPRGRVVPAILGVPEECAQHAIVAAVRALLPRSLDRQWQPLGQSLAAPDAFNTLLAQAGLRVVGDGSVACPYEYPDRELAWQAQASAGPLQAALSVVGEPRLKAAVLRALAPYATNTGGVRIPNRFRYVITVPAEDCPTR
jgi:SAM-dependent methyltransferase